MTDFSVSFLLRDTPENFWCQGGCWQGRSTEGEAVQLDFSLPSWSSCQCRLWGADAGMHP